MDKELNINITVTTKDTDITIGFDPLLSVFPSPDIEPLKDLLYFDEGIVDNYYIYIVKYNKRSTFNIANAENLLNHNENVYPVYDPHPLLRKSITLTDITDTDGDMVEIGKEYVVFIMAKYSEEYKREINSYENWLSSPSPFTT